MAVTEWYEDESFWRELYPFIFSADRLGSAGDELDGIFQLVPFTGRSVLDLCCGPGRHAVALARRGFDVTGVDRSELLLERARRVAGTAGVSVEWIREDMREFVRPGAYDLALNLYTSFGYFQDPRDDRRVLQNLFASVSSGGVVLLELACREGLAAVFEPSLTDEAPDGSVLMRRHEIRDDGRRLHNEWTLVRNGQARTFSFGQTLYSAAEIAEELGRAGFSKIRVHRDVQGHAFSHGDGGMVAVGWKA